jgi:hypothetical protein
VTEQIPTLTSMDSYPTWTVPPDASYSNAPGGGMTAPGDPQHYPHYDDFRTQREIDEATNRRFRGESWTDTVPVVRQVASNGDPTDPQLRLQVVDRLRLLNTRQAVHAFSRRRKDPLGPHGLAFLYYDPAPGTRSRYEVKAGTRMFLDGADVRDLPVLLHAMLDIAVEYASRGRFDPLSTMANRHDPMSNEARFAGIAVSSLDTPEGPWSDVQRRALGPLDVSGRCYTVVSDGTRMLIDRIGLHSTGNLEIRSSKPLDDMTGSIGRSWSRLDDEDDDDPYHHDIWATMDRLYRTVVSGPPKAHERTRRSRR